MGPSLVQSFWPSLTAPAGQTSTHLPQATQLVPSHFGHIGGAGQVGGVEKLAGAQGVAHATAQLQMANILFSPSMLVI
jgi:hypothetical protein